MEQRISLITLGVTDLQRAVDFYEQVVGWKAEPSPPGVVFFDLNGLVFALWPHDELAKDLGMTAGSVPRLPRVFSRSQRPQRGRGRRHFCSTKEPPCDHRQRTAQNILGRILRLFFRPGRSHVGNRQQPILDHPPGRPHIDAEGIGSRTTIPARRYPG